MQSPDFDHTAIQKDLIRECGRTPRSGFSVDGDLPDGPTEVRLSKNDSRFRLNRDTNQELVSECGSYIFDDLNAGLPLKKVSADRVDDLLGGGEWFSDLGYQHGFVDVGDIF